MKPRAWIWVGLLILADHAAASAWTIDTAFLTPPWPKQVVRELEVGRYPVLWRQRVSRRDGLFTAVRFEAPLERQTVWDRANDYSDVGRMTPGVTAVRFLEQSPTRQVIQLDVKVLWKTLQLTFEVEQEPPREIRFRWADQAFGEIRGLCVFDDSPLSPTGGGPSGKTAIELATWFKPSRPVPLGLLLVVERIALLQATKEFLESCEPASAAHQRVFERASMIARRR
ncbi:MAG: hypothetical protein HYY90_00305 [Candidatus Omnitrophica bacterium]|nr:hypothetical protein [Candidatus Omnitrophota bacterium]